MSRFATPFPVSPACIRVGPAPSIRSSARSSEPLPCILYLRVLFCAGSAMLMTTLSVLPIIGRIECAAAELKSRLLGNPAKYSTPSSAKISIIASALLIIPPNLFFRFFYCINSKTNQRKNQTIWINRLCFNGIHKNEN